MDEEISIINTNTRNEKIKNFLVSNKKKIISGITFFIFLLIIYFAFGEYKKKLNIDISDNFNSIVIDYSENNKEKTTKSLVDLIYLKDPTYSPLSLYFIIDNKLINERDKVNELFDIIINDTKLDKEIKNLIILKKGFYNADKSKESELLDILKPLINSDSVWKSHALYLMAEYFYSKNEKQKSKEFFNQIISLENSNEEIKVESQKRLNRDLSE